MSMVLTVMCSGSFQLTGQQTFQCTRSLCVITKISDITWLDQTVVQVLWSSVPFICFPGVFWVFCLKRGSLGVGRGTEGSSSRRQVELKIPQGDWAWDDGGSEDSHKDQVLTPFVDCQLPLPQAQFPRKSDTKFSANPCSAPLNNSQRPHRRLRSKYISLVSVFTPLFTPTWSH